MRVCSKCSVEYPLEGFYLNRGKPGTLCKACVKATSMVRYSRVGKEYSNAQYHKHREKRIPVQREYYKENREQLLLSKREQYQESPEVFLERQKSWRNANLPQVRAHNAKNRAQRDLRIPKWLTEDQLKDIKAIYDSCPEGYEVDHIEPLNGKDRSGLHVSWNLQHLPISENRSKGNRC